MCAVFLFDCVKGYGGFSKLDLVNSIAVDADIRYGNARRPAIMWLCLHPFAISYLTLIFYTCLNPILGGCCSRMKENRCLVQAFINNVDSNNYLLLCSLNNNAPLRSPSLSLLRHLLTKQEHAYHFKKNNDISLNYVWCVCMVHVVYVLRMFCIRAPTIEVVLLLSVGLLCCLPNILLQFPPLGFPEKCP